MSNENIKTCSKCGIERDQNLGSTYSFEIAQQSRIFTKSGKHFCFSCLASGYEVNCRKCHRRINSKSELGYWGGVISVNGSYDNDPDADHFDFRCLGCKNKEVEEAKQSGYNSGEDSNEKCRITGCSNYLSVYLQYKSRGFCTPCGEKNQKEQRIRNKTDEQELENYQQAIDQAQNWWDSLSSKEKQSEICSLEIRLPAQIKKFWNSKGHETDGNQIEGNAQYPRWDTFKNGKLHQSNPTRVPWAIVNEFYEKGSSPNRIIRKDNSPKPNPTSQTPQPITNSDQLSDTVKANPDNSPKLGTNQTLEIKLSPPSVDNPKDGLSNQPNEPKKDEHQVLVINLKDIKKISLVGDNLVIEFNQNSPSQTVVSEQVRDNPVLSKVKNYLQSAQHSTLSQSELASFLSQANTDRPVSNSAPASPSPLFWTAVGIIGITVMARLLLLVTKIKKSCVPKKR